MFLKYGVNVAFMGHEHFYERIKPQKGVAYFIIGSSAKLRKGDLQKSPLTVYGNDSDYAFMLVEIDGDELYFQTINDKGVTLDTGSIRRAGDVQAGPERDHAAGGAAGQAIAGSTGTGKATASDGEAGAANTKPEAVSLGFLEELSLVGMTGFEPATP